MRKSNFLRARRYSLLVLIVLAIFALDLAKPALAASWTTNGPMAAPRFGQTATLLQNGMVLVTGGISSGTSTNGAELYDPSTGKWTITGAMNVRRASHTATLLPNGQVLVAGGNHGTFLATAELYDPISGSWTLTRLLNTLRSGHTATLLPNGQVLVAGGTPVGFAPTAELYDPLSGSWSPTGELNVPRTGHTATLMTNHMVLVAGGSPTNAFTFDTTSVEIYDPSSGIWTITNSLNTARYDHTATLLPDGRIFVAGGTGGANISNIAPLSSAELFNPATGTWTETNVFKAPRTLHSATLLPNGKVLLAGGQSSGGYISAAAIYDPATGTNTTIASMSTPRAQHTATVLANGKVLVTGGQGGSGATNSTEVYDYANGAWTTTGSLGTVTASQTATLLRDGRVLMVVSSVYLYDSVTGAWTQTNNMHSLRSSGHSATLLPSGHVLVAGGNYGGAYLASVELFDPISGTWTSTASMNTPRWTHTATLLPNGKVLVAGGGNGGVPPTALATSEIYNPVTGTWVPTGPLNFARRNHAAVLLSNGKVLIVGGLNPSSVRLSSAELYDPATGSWTLTGSLHDARNAFTATLLPNGKVLVAGGRNSGQISSAELYDPTTGTWAFTGAMTTNRESHTATLLPNGKVLVTGGDSPGGYQATTELYDPTTEIWMPTGTMADMRASHAATLLLNGKLLVEAGINPGFLGSAELYDVGLGFSNAWRPQIASITSPLDLGANLSIGGSQFRGIAEGSSGTGQDSSADYPVLQLRSPESGQTIYLLATDWSTNSVDSVPLLNFPPGYALATIFVNGIQSTSAVVNISVPIPTPATITDAAVQSNGWFQCSFTNTVGAFFAMLVTTNVSLPLGNWTAVGGITEISPGQFQFVDPQAPNNARRFYRLSTP